MGMHRIARLRVGLDPVLAIAGPAAALPWTLRQGLGEAFTVLADVMMDAA